MNHISAEDLQDFKYESTLSNYQVISQKSAIYPGKGTALGIMYAALKLNGEAGEIAEHVGKAFRDDDFMIDNHLTFEKRAAVTKELGDVLWYVAAIAAELGVSLTDIAAINLNKLHDRGNRNALRGSGDDR